MGKLNGMKELRKKKKLKVKKKIQGQNIEAH